jgi:hypothetical protein
MNNLSLGNMSCRVISLLGQYEGRKQSAEELQKLDIEWSFSDAVDGRK